MKYYKERRNAFLDIDEEINKNKKITIDLLEFKISTRYGFGKKIVADRLNNLEQLGMITIKDGVIIKK